MIYLLLILLDKIVKTILLINNISSINRGLILGIKLNQFLIIILSIIILTLLMYSKRYLIKVEIGFNIIICGILMNLSDRILWGGVLDYFRFFNILSYNIADLFILVGIVWISIFFILSNAKLSFKS